MEYIMTSFVPPKPLPVLYAENESEARARKLHEQARKDAAWRATLHPTAPLLAVRRRAASFGELNLCALCAAAIALRRVLWAF